MDEFFTTQHVTKTFGVSHQTVKNWCDEFASHLSPSARPETGRKRVFTTNDLKVFALVAEYHKRGFRYEDAHTALQSGQRGDIPDTESDITPTVPPALLVQLRDELAKRDAIISSLTSERDMERGKVQLLEKQLGERDQQIKELYREIAELGVTASRRDEK